MMLHLSSNSKRKRKNEKEQKAERSEEMREEADGSNFFFARLRWRYKEVSIMFKEGTVFIIKYFLVWLQCQGQIQNLIEDCIPVTGCNLNAKYKPNFMT